MHAITTRLYSFSCRFIQACGLILSLILFAGAFVCTCYSSDMTTQQVLVKWDNPLRGLFFLAVFLLIASGIVRLLFQVSPSPAKILLILTLLWCAALGGLLIVYGRSVPAADALSVYSIAESLGAGDTSVIHPTDSYLSYYPQQIGLVSFYEGLIRLWNLLPFQVPAYHFIKCIYVCLLCVILVFQKRTVHLLWQNDHADCLYLVLAGADLPFIMYSSFVYGEIPSFAAASVGYYYLLRLLKRLPAAPAPDTPGQGIDQKRLPDALLTVLALSASVMLRKNNLILLIAALIILFLETVKNRRGGLLLLGLCIAVCGAGILPAVQKGYELRAGNELRTGVTASSYLAMGMQESSRGKGWYNGFNFTVYQEAGMDSLTADAVSKAAIRDRLQYFKEHPAYAADFYLQKHLSQWADGTYASRQATLATYGGRNSFFRSLYEGPLSRFYIGYCNVWQNALYLGTLGCFFLLEKERRQKGSAPPLFLYLGFTAVLGGFLFHILWEANSRYIFLYSLLLLPYAARGLCPLIIHSPAGKIEKV